MPCLQKQWIEITYISRCHFDSVSAQESSELSPPSLDYDATTTGQLDHHTDTCIHCKYQ